MREDESSAKDPGIVNETQRIGARIKNILVVIAIIWIAFIAIGKVREKLAEKPPDNKSAPVARRRTIVAPVNGYSEEVPYMYGARCVPDRRVTVYFVHNGETVYEVEEGPGENPLVPRQPPGTVARFRSLKSLPAIIVCE